MNDLQTWLSQPATNETVVIAAVLVVWFVIIFIKPVLRSVIRDEIKASTLK
jgi:hypothetical protein